MPAGADTSQLQHDPGIVSSTYIGRSHYTGDDPLDISRHTGLSKLEQKTLELWIVYTLPLRAVPESLIEASKEYCH